MNGLGCRSVGHDVWMTAARKLRPNELADFLLERGDRFVTTEQIAELLGVPGEWREGTSPLPC